MEPQGLAKSNTDPKTNPKPKIIPFNKKNPDTVYAICFVKTTKLLHLWMIQRRISRTLHIS